MQFLGAIKKVASPFAFIQNAEVAEKSHIFGRHRSQIGPNPNFLNPRASSQNSYWDCYGSFDKQQLFSVKFARFRNFFDFAQNWGILESDKLWEIECWRVADQPETGSDGSMFRKPPLIADASTTICTRPNSRAAPLCPNLDCNLCPTLTAHSEPCLSQN